MLLRRTGFGILAAVLSSCSKTERIEDALVVNTSDSYRTVILQDEEEGVREIRELVASSLVEEAWAYLPKQQKWIEIGIDQQLGREVNDTYITEMMLDIEHLERITKENDNIIIYHFHPSESSYFQKIVQESEKSGYPISEWDQSFIRTQIAVRDALPTYNDLITMISNSRVFYEQHPDGNMRYKLASSLGVAEFSLTEKGRVLYQDASGLKITVDGIILWKMGTDTGFYEPNEIKKVQKLSRAISDENIQVSFSEY